MALRCRAFLLPFFAALGCGDGGAAGADAAPGGDAADPTPDAAPSCAAVPWSGGELAITDEGPVRGAAQAGTIAWKGIAYARPPVGALRFHAPEPLGCVAEERAATAYGAICPQVDGDAVIGEEDCLTLDVWAPATVPATPRPILFFMHGGGNVQGSAQLVSLGAPLYDGQELAELGDAVVVTIQYRLGPFGFLVHPDLGAGNYGLRDQILALDWVQRNAAAFGGDPARVLLFGESAGALDTCALLASPLAAGKFAAALMESGGCRASTLADAQAHGEDLADRAGCAAGDAAACLGALDAATLIELGGGEPVSGGVVGSGYGPVVDGEVLVSTPLQALRAGTHNHVPFVIGANANETASLGVPPMTETQYEDRVHAIFGALVGDQVLARYPAADYATPRLAFIQVSTDAQFVCPSRTIARAAAANQSEPVYRYFFTHLTAAHGLELFYVFQKIDDSTMYTPTADDAAVAAALGGYWTRFAATGDPNGAGAVAWPTYDPVADPYLELAATPVAGDGVRTAKCDFWDALSP